MRTRTRTRRRKTCQNVTTPELCGTAFPGHCRKRFGVVVITGGETNDRGAVVAIGLGLSDPAGGRNQTACYPLALLGWISRNVCATRRGE